MINQHFVSTIFIILVTTSFVEARIPTQRIDLQPTVRNELNLVMKNTNELHSACVEQNESSIESATEKVINSLDRAAKHSSMTQMESTHLVKMLSAAKEKLEFSQNFSNEKRKLNLQEAFKELVQISQVFKLEHYNVFFCSKDKSLWLQKSLKPLNPIHPDKFGNCGRLVQ